LWWAFETLLDAFAQSVGKEQHATFDWTNLALLFVAQQCWHIGKSVYTDFIEGNVE
jgi:hypothetical protein